MLHQTMLLWHIACIELEVTEINLKRIIPESGQTKVGTFKELFHTMNLWSQKSFRVLKKKGNRHQVAAVTMLLNSNFILSVTHIVQPTLCVP